MSRPRTLGDRAKMAGARDLTRAYQEILGRAPDKGGFKHYQQLFFRFGNAGQPPAGWPAASRLLAGRLEFPKRKKSWC